MGSSFFLLTCASSSTALSTTSNACPYMEDNILVSVTFFFPGASEMLNNVFLHFDTFATSWPSSAAAFRMDMPLSTSRAKSFTTLILLSQQARRQHDLREEWYTRQVEELAMPQEQWFAKAKGGTAASTGGAGAEFNALQWFWCDASAPARWKPAWQCVHMNGRSSSAFIFPANCSKSSCCAIARRALRIQLVRRSVSRSLTHAHNTHKHAIV